MTLRSCSSNDVEASLRWKLEDLLETFPGLGIGLAGGKGALLALRAASSACARVTREHLDVAEEFATRLRSCGSRVANSTDGTPDDAGGGGAAVAGSLWALLAAARRVVGVSSSGSKPAADAAQEGGVHPRSSVLEAVAAHLEDPNWVVRQAVLCTLGEIAPRGDGRSVAAILARLQDPVPDVRQAAISALGELAARGDEAVVEALAIRLRDRAPVVRQEAALALGVLARPGCDVAIEALTPRAVDTDAEVRRVALAALGELLIVGEGSTSVAGAGSGLGPAAVLAPLLPCLRDASTDVRLAAVRALKKVANRSGGPLAPSLVGVIVAHVLPLLGAKECGAALQIATLQTLSSLLGGTASGLARTVPAVAAAIAACCADGDPTLRYEAAIALRHAAASRGEPAAVSAAIGLLQDGCRDVRKAGAETLGAVCRTGDGDGAALRALLAVLAEDPHASVRAAAALALGRAARRGDPTAISALAARMQDEQEVRIAALRALALVSERGHPTATRVARMALEDSSNGVEVRAAAAIALGALANVGDSAAAAALACSLRDRSDVLPRAATEALVALAEEAASAPEHLAAVPSRAVADLVLDPDHAVRRAALAAVAAMARRQRLAGRLGLASSANAAARRTSQAPVATSASAEPSCTADASQATADATATAKPPAGAESHTGSVAPLQRCAHAAATTPSTPAADASGIGNRGSVASFQRCAPASSTTAGTPVADASSSRGSLAPLQRCASAAETTPAWPAKVLPERRRVLVLSGAVPPARSATLRRRLR